MLELLDHYYLHISGGVEPGTFNLLYSITFMAIVIIGGVGTVLGPLFGAFFFTMLPGIIQVFYMFRHFAELDLFLIQLKLKE